MPKLSLRKWLGDESEYKCNVSALPLPAFQVFKLGQAILISFQSLYPQFDVICAEIVCRRVSGPTVTASKDQKDKRRNFRT